MSKGRYLLDVNVLIALTDEEHVHHEIAMRWFETAAAVGWGICAFTEAGFLRVTTNPRYGPRTIEGAAAILRDLANRPGFSYRSLSTGWTELVSPFSERIFGHQQVTDAYLLGLAIKEGGMLVTFDKAILSMAGTKHRKHVLLLE